MSLDLLIGVNRGIPGLCSIHANSADDAHHVEKRARLRSGQPSGLPAARDMTRRAAEVTRSGSVT